MKEYVAQLVIFFRRVAIVLFFAGVCAFASLSAITQLPTVQAFLIKRISAYIGGYVKYPINIGGVQLSLIDHLVLHNVVIKDRNQLDMIVVKKITASFKIIKLFQRDIEVDKAEVFDPVVSLRYDSTVQDVNISDFIFSLIQLGTDPNTPKPPHVGKYKEFVISKVVLHRGTCSYHDPGYVPYTDRFDFTHFKLKNIDIEAKNLKIVADTFSLDVEKLFATDSFSGTKIKDTRMSFSVCENFLQMKSLHAYIGNSRISDFVRFEFDRLRQLSHITDSVYMYLNLVNSVVHASDLSVFFPQLSTFEETWQVSGSMNGKVNNFKVQNVSAKFGKNSTVFGNATLTGLPFWSRTYCRVDLLPSDVFLPDVVPYGMPRIAEKFPLSKIAGVFSGLPSDFFFYGDYASTLGSANFELKMAIPENEKEPQFIRSKIEAKDLNLASVLNQQNLGKITGIAKIESRGNVFPEITLSLNAQLSELEYQNYVYKNGMLNVFFDHKHLKASADIQDTALTLGLLASAYIDSTDGTMLINGKIRDFDLKATRFSKKYIKLSTDFYWKTNFSNNLDDLLGNLEISNFEAKDSINISKIPDAICELSAYKGQKNFLLKSSVADISLYGDFSIKKLEKFFDELRADLWVTWKNNDSLTTQYYRKKNNASMLWLDYNFKFKECKNFMQIFFPEFVVTNYAEITGNAFANSVIGCNVHIHADTLKAYTIGWVDLQLNVKFSKNRFDNQVHADATLTSKYQLVNNNTYISTENLNIEANWNNQVIDFDFGLKQYNESNQAYISGNFSFWDNQKKLKLLTTDFKLLDKKWKLSDDNLIWFNDSKWVFKDIVLTNGEQKVSLIGNISANENDVAAVQIENLKLQNFNKLFNINTFGDINGYIILKDLYGQPKIYSQLSVQEFMLKKLYIGNAHGTTQWDAQHKRLVLGFDIQKEHSKILELQGSYYPNAGVGKDNLDVNIQLNGAPTSLFEPLLDEILSEFQGTMQGKIMVKGGLSRPKINGEIQVADGAFKVNYLNITYAFDDKIILKPEAIELKNVVLQDKDGQMGILNARIGHQNYKNFTYDISGLFKNVWILDVPYSDSCVYYGKAKASGNFHLHGNTEKMVIKIDAQSNKETQLFVPLQGSAYTQNADFIVFNTKSTKEKTSNKNLTVDPKQNNLLIVMDFNIELTPEAYCELILDPISGDKISGYGNGKLNMQINTEGDYLLFGNYIFEKESYYNFSLFNSITKRFTIQPGSRVIFSGDPYAAHLDVTASYDDRVPLYTLIPDTSLWKAPGIRVPYPVSTYMFLKGPMLRPTVTYDIKITDYPSVVGGVPLFNFVTAFENRIRNNDNEMGYQVMGLLLFRRFLNQNTNIDAAFGGTVSEVLTSHLSNIISKVDKNLSVDLNMNGLNRDALNAMQVRVSYTLLDGKVRVTRSTSNVQNQSATSSVIGDWTVEYMLTDDGRFRAKGFNRNNPNPLATGTSNASNMSAGASLMHTSSFNTLNPFQKKKKNKKKFPTDTMKPLEILP